MKVTRTHHEPFSPALLRLLNHVIKTCDEQGKPVTLCGEMAGRPRCFLPLFGMGLRRLSMSPAFVPSIRRSASPHDAGQVREASGQPHIPTARNTNLSTENARNLTEMSVLDLRD